MPFGLCNAPGTFQRLMERMFGAKHCQTLLLYLDDMYIVLSWLSQEGLKVKLEKCQFFQKEVQYLGHVISQGGMSTGPSKVLAVADWLRPTTVTELRSFLGFASYHRRLMRDFAKLATLLHRLVAEVARDKRKKNCDWRCEEVWSAECESFSELKT